MCALTRPCGLKVCLPVGQALLYSETVSDPWQEGEERAEALSIITGF